MKAYLCTQQQFEKARDEVLRFFQRNGFASRRQLTAFKVFGLPYDAIELALRHLLAKGIVEELYVLPSAEKRTGVRAEVYGLTSALDARTVLLPEGVVRERLAFELIAEVEHA